MKTDRLSGDFFIATFSEAVPNGLRFPSSPVVPTAAVNVLSSNFSPRLSLHSYVLSAKVPYIAQGPDVIAFARTRLGAAKPEAGRILHFHF